MEYCNSKEAEVVTTSTTLAPASDTSQSTLSWEKHTEYNDTLILDAAQCCGHSTKLGTTDDHDCPICLEPLCKTEFETSEQSDIVKHQKCNRDYHASCMAEWLSGDYAQGGRCPLCKEAMVFTVDRPGELMFESLLQMLEDPRFIVSINISTDMGSEWPFDEMPDDWVEMNNVEEEEENEMDGMPY